MHHVCEHVGKQDFSPHIDCVVDDEYAKQSGENSPHRQINIGQQVWGVVKLWKIVVNINKYTFFTVIKYVIDIYVYVLSRSKNQEIKNSIKQPKDKEKRISEALCMLICM